MRRRHVLLNAMTLPWLAACAVPDTRADQAPPAGVTAIPVSCPPPGARWRARVTETAFLRAGTVEDRTIAAAPVTLPVFLPSIFPLFSLFFSPERMESPGRGKAGLGLDSGGGRITVLDPATCDVIATLAGNTPLTLNLPAAGPFGGSLWVGKRWRTVYDHSDFTYGRTWNAAEYRAHVPTFEDVTVPAGTFRAFRVEALGGVGTSVFGNGFGARGSSPGIETTETHWYAPDVKLPVKSVIERLGSHHRGAGRTVIELLERPV